MWRTRNIALVVICTTLYVIIQKERAEQDSETPDVVVNSTRIYSANYKTWRRHTSEQS